MPRESNLPVVGARVTFFPGNDTPWIEIWTKDSHGDFPTYPYYDIFRPQCKTQEEWLAMLTTGVTTVLNPKTGEDSAT